MASQTFFERHLSPSLSSTFGGGEGDKSARWDRSGKDDVKMRPAAAGDLETFSSEMEHLLDCRR
jgi:hypothetical protein